MTVYNVLDLGIPRVIAKAANKEHGAILERLGAEPIFPETDTALRVAAMLLETEAVDMIKLYDNYVISEIVIPAGVRQCTVEDLRMDDYHLKLVAVEIMQNGQKVTLTDWSQNQILHGGDFIVVMIACLFDVVRDHIFKWQHTVHIKIPGAGDQIPAVGIFSGQLIADQMTSVVEILTLDNIIFHQVPACRTHRSDAPALFRRHQLFPDAGDSCAAPAFAVKGAVMFIGFGCQLLFCECRIVAVDRYIRFVFKGRNVFQRERLSRR